MFFWKKKNNTEMLSKLVARKNRTGSIFTDINNDLASAIEKDGQNWPPIMLMAYAYSRRIAAAALSIQKIVPEDHYDYVKVFFNGMQIRTKTDIEFQHEAYNIALDYLKGYTPVITKTFAKSLIEFVEGYEIPSQNLNDSELFHFVIEFSKYNQKHGAQ